MFSEIMSTISGITIFPIITTIIFFLIFIGIVIWAFRADKSYISKMSELPLDSTRINGD
ncbi:MAG: CcoQ/FixQ family Cbb3-type cytochrome c oxidase assembly chaperone [Calditrichaceae bacterium]|nr:CcoQ/FixQ family Cbb3-type cytochrome c oxidase assembly chaperone [Calditrichaceae bacterium]